MVLQDQPRHREEALIDVAIAVKTAKRHRTTLVVHVEAERIFRQHPDCPVPLAALEAEMIRLGVSDRVAMQFG